MICLSTLAHSTALATKAYYMCNVHVVRLCRQCCAACTCVCGSGQTNMTCDDSCRLLSVRGDWRILTASAPGLFPLTSSKWLDGEYLYTRGHCFVRTCHFTNVRTSDIELPLINHNSDWIISFDFWILLLRVSNIRRFGYLQFQMEIGSYTGDAW